MKFLMLKWQMILLLPLRIVLKNRWRNVNQWDLYSKKVNENALKNHKSKNTKLDATTFILAVACGYLTAFVQLGMARRIENPSK